GDIIQTITTSGYVDSVDKNDYSLVTQGKVLYTLEKDDIFRKGDVLLEIDNSRQELLIAQAEENLNAARNSLSIAKLNYQQALDANHIAIQLAETGAQQAELSTRSALVALENANNMADKSEKSAKVALENAKKLFAEAKDDAKSNPLITDTQLAQYEANVDSAEANYDSVSVQSRSTVKSAEIAYEQSILGQSTSYWSNLSSTQSAKSQIEAAAINIRQAETQLRLSEVSLELARLDMDNITYAPYDGIVLASTYKEGQYASPGMNAISIISNDFIIKAEINETDVVNLKTGQDVDIILDAYPETTFKGKIIEISRIPTSTGGVVTFDFIIKPDRENAPELIYGLSANLEITEAISKNVLYAPIDSIIEENGKTYVNLVSEDGSIKKTEVVTGASNYDFIEIKSGLNEGDTILISSINYINAIKDNLESEAN
ncbi:MAG: HlyD family efflux transporter periplasmic adaptor subunit, partial [Actinomycetota bacterium]|nr:HlyD family efflux transporter periplasmic adaptor subunit [Actinomycetota bacterium]